MAMKHSRLRSALLVALIGGAPCVAQAAPPPAPVDTADPSLVSLPELASFNKCDRQSKTARFRITLPEEAELKDLVGWISSVSCQKFVWNPAIRGGKITVVAPEPVTLAEAYGAFHSSLETMNLAVRDAGDFFEIVETKGVAGQNVPVIGPGKQPAPSDRFVTQVVRPHPERVTDVAAVFDHLKSAHGSVTTVGGIVIVTDTANNIRRAMRVSKQIDVVEETPEGLFVYPLPYGEAEDVADILRQLFATDASTPAPTRSASKKKPSTKSKAGAKRGDAPVAGPAAATSATVTRVVADVRSNSLFIVAPRKDYPVIRSLLDRLTGPSVGDEGQISVFRLSYANPEELQAVVTQVLAASKSATSQGVTITADVATRSLIVDAPRTESRRIEALIARLDVERRQVYMEVYILEVSVDHSLQVAAGAHMFHRNASNPDGPTSVVSTNPSSDFNSVAPSAGLAGLAAGVFGNSLPGSFLGQEVPSFGVMIQALETSTDVNTVSEPHVIAADNRTAKITIGEVIPVNSGVTFPGGAGGNTGLVPVQNTTRETVALDLEITPHVNDHGEVMLDLKLLDEQVLPTADAIPGVRTSKRALELEDVVARDGQPIILGGLIKDSDSIVETKVPGLGSIPVFGWLFKSRRRPKKKINLLMILIPHVIDSPDDARRIHQQRIAERREFIERETSFKRRDLDVHVNYRKKSGLLSAVDSEYRRMRSEDRDRYRAELELRRTLPTELVVPEDGQLTSR